MQPLATVDEAHASLLLISREVTTELNEARVALEAFADKPDDRGALHRFAAHIHLARGALRLAEIYGGALLAEEMEHVARYVDAHSGEGRADSDGLDALMRAMEQLPAYVERVATGARDLPLGLLPLLNDLRAVRGSALLSEGTLLLLNLRSDEPARPASPFSGEREIADLARRLRPRFQVALLGWIRNERAEENLAHLADIASQFERAASTQPLFQLWWVVGAVLEALQGGGVDGNVSVKRLLGHVDREMKRLHDQGEQQYSAAPPLEVLNNLLYYVAQSTVAGPRISEVRGSFKLDDMVASRDADLADVDTMSAPSVRLMRTVAAAIREDLTRVKDVLDIFVRKGVTQVDDLAPQLEMLRKISDTLGVLGLGALRARVDSELESLRAIVERRMAPDDTALLDIAAALIAVEDSLDSQLLRQILPGPAPAGDAPAEPTDEEFRLVQEAVLRECIINMARIKEAVTHSLSAPAEAQGLDQVPQLVRGITAGLLMLGKQRAVEVMERIGRALGTVVRPDPNSLAPARLDRLADAIVAVEYYMETLQAGRADQWQMLEAAEASLGDLEPSARVIPLREAASPAQPPAPGFESAASAAPEAPAADRSFAPPAGGEPRAPAAREAERPAAPRVAQAIAAVDPEFVQLFVEEARENVARIAELFPRWEQDPADGEALRDLRRAFHTLKGSGRMVGAQRVGEFSWSIESLLNRVISATLPRSPEIVSVARDAVAAMPQLIDEIDGGMLATADVAGIMARADAISGREGPALPGSSPQAPPVAAAVPEPEPEPAPVSEDHAVAVETGMDPVLRDIFRKETAGHILVVRQYLERCAQAVAPHAVTEALYRAVHTLSGIAKTAGARQGIKVAEPMEHYIRKLHDNGHGFGEEALLLLRETVRMLETVSEHVDENTGFFPEQGRLAAGWLTLERALDAELARLAEAAERTLQSAWRPTEPEVVEISAPLAAEDLTEPSLPSLGEELAQAGADDLDHTSPHAALTEPVAAQLPEPAPEAEPEPAHVAPEPAFETPEATGDDGEFDADIAAIFGEEATELLEQADVAIGRWREDRADRSQVTELKRLLHTLKGGARMAGLRTMGDLSHEVESFLTSIESGETGADAGALDVLQTSLDELHRMRELANSGQRIVPARELIARIRSATAGAVEVAVPAALQPPVVETPSAEPVVELRVEPVAELSLPPEPEPAVEPVVTVEEHPALEEIVLTGEFHAVTSPDAELTEQYEASTAPQAEQPVEHLVEQPGEVASPLVEPAAETELYEEIVLQAPEEAAPELPAASSALEAAPGPEFEELPPVLAPSSTPPEEPRIAAETQFPPTAFTPVTPVLPGREPSAPAERAELARVDADLLDDLLNNAGEVSIFRARIEQQMTSFEFNLAELDRTVTRLREQLRKLELETEAQILHTHQHEEAAHRTDFDPLELDRYSTIQQLSRALAESVSDVASIEGLLANLNRDTQNLLQQQGRVVTEVQNGLMRTRMVPFQRHVQRLTRVVRQAAHDEGKRVELAVEGASGELDRQVLERMLPPFEHMLRNAVVHGIETPAARAAAGKPEAGQITLRLQREGAEVVITVEDDGAGLDVPAIRAKARQMGLLRPEQDLTDEEALQLVLEPGFSTARHLTQQAGRGVGMDVVATEVKKLGGGLFIESRPGYGARFTIRLPFTLAITQALIVRVHDELFALPMATVEGVARLTRPEIERHLAEDQPTFTYGGNPYRFQHLGTFVGSGPSPLPETDAALPVILVRAGEHSTALVTDELAGSREIVVKPVGPQIAGIRGISGATILGDGRIVVILDMGTLVRSEWRARSGEPSRALRDDRIFTLVVDDSITVRRVTQRLLERNGMRVMTAKDGVEAMALLQEHVPDVILLDIEMPRMDGYEVAAHVRNDARIADVPIIMITSRVGDKHRARAIELGVDDYLGKPYQESQLLDAIEPLVLARRRMQA
jgi:chemosensory pili system protein ChpA (sensor histidine kinase/response regulator)